MSSSSASDACAVAASVFMLATGRAAEQVNLSSEDILLVAACDICIFWPCAAHLYSYECIRAVKILFKHVQHPALAKTANLSRRAT